MLEVGLGIAMCVMVGKIAAADDESAIAWGGLTFLICLASFFVVPLPFLRILGAAFLAFILMIAYKMIRER